MNGCGGRVDAWRDGALTPEEGRAMEAHLRACPACAREAEEARRLSAFMAAARLPALPAEARERLLRLPQRRAEFTLVRLSECVMAAAAMVLAACVGWLALTDAQLARGDRSPALWESAAVTPRAADAQGETESYVARWIVSDLGRGPDRD
jgi:anti-sigma factor RsiW